MIIQAIISPSPAAMPSKHPIHKSCLVDFFNKIEDNPKTRRQEDILRAVQIFIFAKETRPASPIAANIDIEDEHGRNQK